MSREAHAGAIAAAKAAVGEVQEALSHATSKFDEAEALVANATDRYESGNLEAHQAYTEVLAVQGKINEAYAHCENSVRHLDGYLGSM